ncbi:predicted protein [Plenodomus lingam JN3]|uniref:Rhodopsin domain-containing protein n=1 Tax=Leptosphaeria maculans (strain JN3 / isolate v23.1.3 / race Av1-4-5-6-7-8) TaxID=985895 RepID=E4ZGZ8_LEPMJ|nr:predicted protein [Plenodomus lingam JN3]CBX90568.1 predicted protein [Plenodomus lingam JN3]
MSNLSPEEIAELAKEDNGPKTRAIAYSFTVTAVICVSLRMYTRIRYLGRSLGWEDYTIGASIICAIITAVFQILQFNAGGGRHAVTIPFPDGLVPILKNLYISIIFYNLSLTLTKVSILLQYGRIFTVREMRIPLRIVMAMCISYGIAVICTLWYSHAGFNILIDVLVATLPVRVIWKLQIPKQQKIALLSILTIGWFVCVVSILRLHALTVMVANPQDTTWYSAASAYWSTIEMNMAILCASLPALKPLLVNIIPGFASRTTSRGYGPNSGRRPSFPFATIGGSKAKRTVDEELEMEPKRTINTQVYPSASNTSVHGKDIYVTRQFEQHCHFDRDVHNSDSESQKDLADSESQKGLVEEPPKVYEKR